LETVVAQPIHSRAGVILSLAILSIILLGPITGIPAWMMANQDMRDIQAGLIPNIDYGRLRTGKSLAIIGTFFFWISLILFALLLLVLGMILFVLVMVFGVMMFG